LFLSHSLMANVITIEITGTPFNPIKIAVVPFQWQGQNLPPAEIASIITSDLYRSGRFNPIKETELTSKPVKGSEIVFADWEKLDVDYVVVGQLNQRNSKYEIRFELFDVFRGEQLSGYNIPSRTKQLRNNAHVISDIIYEKITGQKGDFATQVAYVTAIKKQKQLQYSLHIADSDGYNAQQIVISDEPLLSPAWSPDASKIAYVSYEDHRPLVYIQETATGKKKKVISFFKGINGAPAWSPDGKKLALTLSQGDNPDIYIIDLANNSRTRLTKSFAIDTEPAWSPDGRFIIFTSDRGGKPQLYRVPSIGGRIQRLTFDGEYNARASYSPNGQNIVMVRGEGGKFQIAVLDLGTGFLRILTSHRMEI